MSQLPTVSSSGHPTGWALAGLMVALVLGVIGMHGVGPHGVSTKGHVEYAMVSDDQTAAGEHGNHLLSAGSQAMPTIDGMSLASSSGAHDPGLLDLCMAVLLGLAVFLLIALAGGRGPALVLHVQQSRAGTLSRAHGPDPPSLTQLSLLRC